MKKSIFNSIIIITLGLLITLSPRFLFKVCGSSCCCADIPQCHWSAQALLGIGFLITALGLCFFVFSDSKIQLGLLIGVFFASIIAICIPNVLIGGCPMTEMICRRVAFPAVTIISCVLLVYSVVIIVINMKKVS